MKTLFTTILFLFSFATAFASTSPMEPNITQIKVMETSNNTGTIFGLRLNEHVNRKANPKALDAVLECNDEDGFFNISLCDEDGECETTSEDPFWDFYTVEECWKYRDVLKKKLKTSNAACITAGHNKQSDGRSYPMLFIGYASDCD